MKLPNGNRAVVDLEKLTDYCLNPAHLRGRHKARVFRAVLGISRQDAFWLRGQFLASARDKSNATPGEGDEYGQRYVLDFEVERFERRATVRTCWIVRTGEDFPRLTTCHVL